MRSTPWRMKTALASLAKNVWALFWTFAKWPALVLFCILFIYIMLVMFTGPDLVMTRLVLYREVTGQVAPCLGLYEVCDALGVAIR